MSCSTNSGRRCESATASRQTIEPAGAKVDGGRTARCRLQRLLHAVLARRAALARVGVCGGAAGPRRCGWLRTDGGLAAGVRLRGRIGRRRRRPLQRSTYRCPGCSMARSLRDIAIDAASRFSENAWPPVPSATKKSSRVRAGFAVASIAARPGLAIGPGGSPSIDVGVVRRRLGDLAAHDRPAERALAADQAVDDRRIGLQLHPLLEPVDEHRGDARAFVRLAGFLLDDRGERHQFFRRSQRQIAGARRSHVSCTTRFCACCMRWITCSRGVPRVTR